MLKFNPFSQRVEDIKPGALNYVNFEKEIKMATEIKIKLEGTQAVIPNKATDGSAGFDLTAISETFITEAGGPLFEYDTGVAFEIPKNMVGLVFPRSSISKMSLSLSNAVGVIDSDYRGTVKFKFRITPPGKKYKVGDRIGQIVFVPIPEIELVAVDKLSDTTRGSSGFGSSGT
jgi:dUTP pyrophosphatase